MRSTYITAFFIGVLVVVWLASGQFGEEPPRPPASVAEQNRNAAPLAEEKPAGRRSCGDQLRPATSSFAESLR